MWFEKPYEDSFPAKLCFRHDVWLYNRWGTPAARGHDTLDADVDFQYWNRTIDEGASDIGTAID